MPGPIPNREEDLARPRHRKGKDQVPVTKGTLRPVRPDWEPDPDWHPLAIDIFESMKTSGQADFFQDSDWAFARSICEDLSHYKNSYKRSGQMLASIMSALERLLLTEGDRRRVRIELDSPVVESTPARVVAIAGYKAKLAAPR